jgi:hypothetical protein
MTGQVLEKDLHDGPFLARIRTPSGSLPGFER